MIVPKPLGPGDDDQKDRGMAAAVSGPLAPGAADGIRRAQRAPTARAPFGPGELTSKDEPEPMATPPPAAKPGDGPEAEYDVIVRPAAGPGDVQRPAAAIRRKR